MTKRISGCRTEYPQKVTVLAQDMCGRYTIQVYRHWAGDICYRVLCDGLQLRCWTKSEEEHFPKMAAKMGTKMVREVEAFMGEEAV